MKQAIDFLRRKKIEVTEDGYILSGMPSSESGLDLINELEEIQCDDFNFYTIIGDKLEPIDSF